jgi:flagellar hook protein FlgE
MTTMSSTSSIALSGMNAARLSLDAAANNIANAQTPGFRREQVRNTVQVDGGVSTAVSPSETQGPALEQDLVAQLQAKNAFLANLAVFRTSDQMAGALLKLKA